MDILKDPIPELIRKIAIPASVGFFFQTMFHVVDTYFAGLISTHALAALSLSFPIFFMIIAMGAGIAQGSTALIANALGARDEPRARHFSVQALSFGILFALFLTGLGWTAAPFMFQTLGASGDYLAISLAYMNVIIAGTVFFLSQSILNASLNALGNTRTFRNVLIAGFFLNVILDPWFQFGGLGIPAMGIRGIALATVLVQFLGACYLIGRVRKTHLWKGVAWRAFAPDPHAFREIMKQGIPASLNMISVAAGIFVITWFVSRFSAEGVAAYGIATRVEQILLLPTIGLNIAVLTLTGQNNGGRLFSRVGEIWNAALKYGIGMMLIGGVAIFGFTRPLMALFTEDTAVVEIGSEYLRIAAITLCAYVILYQTVYMLQGLKRPMYAIWIGLYRQILAPCVVFYILADWLDWRLKGIWWGIFLVTWSASIVTYYYGVSVLKQVSKE
ncbi:MAG: MATE family efflux transporter [Verrucomicrobia bacterium]|nr:MATE family efflux transporter [Verrucomicrobiota bacterium]